jgi:hypothetical protein
MKISRRTFINWTGTGLLGTTVAGSIAAHAQEQTTNMRQLALGMPAATGIGRKYDANGKALSFPGNTILCHLRHHPQAYAAMTNIVASLQARIGSKNIAWTPPTSYHMTVFEGSLDLRRRPGDWPHLLSLDAPLDACNRFIGNKLRKFELGIELPIQMVADESLATITGAHIPLRPIDAAENRRLRSLRDRLSDVTGIRQCDHDGYKFHSTFGYYIHQFDSIVEERRYQTEWLNAIRELRQRVPVIALRAPEFCVFDSMDEFRPQFFLANR